MSGRFELQGRTAVVTGGAAGLGYGMARGLAEAGSNLILISRRTPDSEQLAQLRSYGGTVEHLSADLADLERIPEIIEKAIQLAHGKVDILVNNSGIIRRAPAAEHSLNDWHDVIDLNLNSLFYLCQGFGNHMLKHQYGKIINIASMLSFQGGINVPGYTAAKHGVAGLTKALANEWAASGVHVNGIAPGYMETDNTAAIRQNEKRASDILERIPAKRWGLPEDLAGPVVFLASSASDYMHGHILCVDGGWMCR